LFKDPFDVPRELAFGLSYEAMGRAVNEKIVALLEHPPEDLSGLNATVSLMVQLASRVPLPEKRREFIAAMRDREQEQRYTGTGMEGIRALWRSTIPDLRILCLTEEPTHSAMWLHYADGYKGVVLEFKCDDDLDSASLAARQIKYGPNTADLFTAEGWAELIVMPPEAALKALFDIATLTKSPDWSYEREWRIATPKRPDDRDLFSDYPFDARELLKIYLGPLMDPICRESIFKAAAKYPNARLLDVAIGLNGTFSISEVSA
jgi:hypothetical protein